MITLSIPLKIFPKPRPRMGKYGNFYTPRDKREDNLESYMKEYMVRNKLKPFTNNLRVDCDFYIKSKSRSDLDNYIKTIFDCGNNIIWKDDKQIKSCLASIWDNWKEDEIIITIAELKEKK